MEGDNEDDIYIQESQLYEQSLKELSTPHDDADPIATQLALQERYKDMTEDDFLYDNLMKGASTVERVAKPVKGASTIERFAKPVTESDIIEKIDG